MSNGAQLKQAMYGLIEASRPISEFTGVPVEALVIAMLTAVKRDAASSLIEATNSFRPLCVAPAPTDGSTIVPTSARYEHMLALIQRDNQQLYKKLIGLD